MSGRGSRGQGGSRRGGGRTSRGGRSGGGGGGRSGGGRSGRAGKKGGAGISRRRFLKLGLGAAAVVATGAAGDAAAGRLNGFGSFDAGRLAELRRGRTTPLLDAYPALAAQVPWRPLATLPTPVEPLPALDGAGDVRLFVKRDDRTSRLFGGNKVRKLEHFLAEADLAGRTTLITLGGIGTNHGLATALHGEPLGFRVRVAMFDQPLTPWVERNLRAFATTRAELRYAGGELRAARAARDLYTEASAAGELPYFIMVGGSSRLGSLGYVNAGLELGRQVRAGEVPEPDRIFVALGSGGTAAGLAVGCRLAGLRSRICAVRASSVLVANSLTVRWLANDLAGWLRAADATVPRVWIGFGEIDVIGDQIGDGYGHPSEAGTAAREWAAPKLELEPTYTAKALAACLAWCRRSARPGETVLFWNTASAATLPQAPSLDALPQRLRERLARA